MWARQDLNPGHLILTVGDQYLYTLVHATDKPWTMCSFKSCNLPHGTSLCTLSWNETVGCQIFNMATACLLSAATSAAIPSTFSVYKSPGPCIMQSKIHAKTVMAGWHSWWLMTLDWLRWWGFFFVSCSLCCTLWWGMFPCTLSRGS